MAVLPEPFKEGFRFHAFYSILSCGVDLREDEDVGVIKCREKILEQGLRSRVAMGLKYGDDSFPPAGPVLPSAWP